MGLFLKPSHRHPVSIVVCDRCKRKRQYDALTDDPNAPGLRVCTDGCADNFDPWRLPPRKTEDIAIPYPRPDEPLDA